MNGFKKKRATAIAVAVATGAAALMAGGGPAAAADPGAPVLRLVRPAPVAVAPADVTTAQTTVEPDITWHTTAASLAVQATVTIDARRLAKIATVTFSDNCTVARHVATCQEMFYEDGLTPKTNIGGETQMTVAAKDGVPLGSRATYKVSGTSDDAVLTGATGTVEVGGPAYDQTTPVDRTGLAVGTVVQEPLAFTNTGDRPSASTVLLLSASPGLNLPQRFSNCEYSTRPGTRGSLEAICTIPGTVQPGETAHLATPLRAKVGRTAYYTFLDSQIVPAGDPATVAFAKGRTWTAGTGDALALTVDDPGTVSDAPAGDVSLPLNYPDSDYRINSLQADNTADFGVTGATATAAQGDTVTMDFSMTNHGPATIFDRSGEGIGLTVTPPAGTTIVGSSANCFPSQDNNPGITAHGPYACDSSYLVPSGKTYDFSLTLRVDQVVPGAQGTVAIAWSPDGSWRPAYDTDAANDTATLSLN